eukprot:1158995-Pelagomonas_calceolata.AAC.6
MVSGITWPQNLAVRSIIAYNSTPGVNKLVGIHNRMGMEFASKLNGMLVVKSQLCKLVRGMLNVTDPTDTQKDDFLLPVDIRARHPAFTLKGYNQVHYKCFLPEIIRRDLNQIIDGPLLGPVNTLKGSTDIIEDVWSQLSTPVLASQSLLNSSWHAQMESLLSQYWDALDSLPSPDSTSLSTCRMFDQNACAINAISYQESLLDNFIMPEKTKTCEISSPPDTSLEQGDAARAWRNLRSAQNALQTSEWLEQIQVTTEDVAQIQVILFKLDKLAACSNGIKLVVNKLPLCQERLLSPSLVACVKESLYLTTVSGGMEEPAHRAQDALGPIISVLDSVERLDVLTAKETLSRLNSTLSNIDQNLVKLNNEAIMEDFR